MRFEKKLVLVTFLFVFAAFLAMAVMMERFVPNAAQQYFSPSVPVEYREVAKAASSGRLHAEVKGSIYSTGENMTVFGACFDGSNYLLPDAMAFFTAWYPNGTVMMGPNATMQAVTDDFQGYSPNGTGRWLIHVTMPATLGTYLTELRCEYDGEWAVAIGEWQNPRWVERVGDTYSTVMGINQTTTAIQSAVANLTVNIDSFRNETQDNFSSVLNAIAALSGNASNGEVIDVNFAEMQRQIRALDQNQWVLDSQNPFYTFGSGLNRLMAVDMLWEDQVYVAGEQIAAKWDGTTWSQFTNISASPYVWRGVGSVPSNIEFAWFVGTNGTAPMVSINGAPPIVPSLPNSTATGLNDVRLFTQPNTPGGLFNIVLLADDGRVYISSDNGASWSYLSQLDASDRGRLSQVVENYRSGAPTSGYFLMAGQGSKVMTYDGATVNTYTIAGIVKDVSLMYADLGYVVAAGVNESYVYKFNGTGFVLDYTIDDITAVPMGVQAITQDDVWIATRNPGVFYHFDGVRWEYTVVPFSDVFTVVVSFVNTTLPGFGLNDMSVLTPKAGYAIGDDGIVLIFKRHYDTRLDELFAQLRNQTNVSVGGLNDSIAALYAYVQAMNASVMQSLGDVQLSLQSMNSTVNYKLDAMNMTLTAIQGNVTYSQMYMETTMTPLINATYNGVLDILVQLGIIGAKLNQTIQLQNQTLQIVNETQQDVNLLVNRSNRFKAWTTQ